MFKGRSVCGRAAFDVFTYKNVTSQPALLFHMECERFTKRLISSLVEFYTIKVNAFSRMHLEWFWKDERRGWFCASAAGAQAPGNCGHGMLVGA